MRGHKGMEGEVKVCEGVCVLRGWGWARGVEGGVGARRSGSGVSRPVGRGGVGGWGVEPGRQRRGAIRREQRRRCISASQGPVYVSRVSRVCLVHLLTRGAHCAGSQMRVPAASAAMRDATRCSASALSAGHDACQSQKGRASQGGGGRGRKPRKRRWGGGEVKRFVLSGGDKVR